MAAEFDVSRSLAAIREHEVRVEAAVRSAVADAAHLIERGAKQRAPVRTGTLRRSIDVVGPNAIGPATYEAYVGPTVVYGRRVELGFHGTDRLGRNYDQQGRPYLEPAVAEATSALSAIFISHIGGL